MTQKLDCYRGWHTICMCHNPPTKQSKKVISDLFYKCIFFGGLTSEIIHWFFWNDASITVDVLWSTGDCLLLLIGSVGYIASQVLFCKYQKPEDTIYV